MSMSIKTCLAAAALTFTVGIFSASAADLSASDIRLVRQSRTSLYAAIQMAEKATAGATFDAFSTVDGGKLVFTVVVHSGDQVLEVKVDAKAAKIISKAGKGPVASYIDGDGDEAIDLSGMKRPLIEAAKTAEISLKGRAVGAEFKADKGKTEFVVLVANARNVLTAVTIDAATGTIITDKAAMIPEAAAKQKTASAGQLDDNDGDAN